MKKQVCLYILLICVLAQAGGNALLLLQYSLNKEYITQEFCINKQEPALGCEGSCHLQKQLKQLDNSTTGKQHNIKPIAEINWICQHMPGLQLNLAASASYLTPCCYTTIYKGLTGTAPEHPPQLFMLA